MQSMTGFGEAKQKIADQEYRIEAKSVNSRFLDIRTYSPAGALGLNHRIENEIRKRFHRGKFEVSIHIRAHAVEGEKRVDFDTLTKIIKNFKQRGEMFASIDLATLALINREWFFEKAQKFDEDLIAQLCQKSFEALRRSRQREGLALKKKIVLLLKTLEQHTGKIAKLSLKDIKRRHVALKKQLAETKLQHASMEERDIPRTQKWADISLVTDKFDITEEADRLKIHIAHFKALLREKKPVGRELDFLIQEMNREVNTMGSKSLNSDISKEIVASKSDLEKIREQVQNLE